MSNEKEAPQVAHKKKVIFRTYQTIWYVLWVVEVLLAFRVMLKMVGANPLSGFANFVYTISDVFALPFAGIFGATIAGVSVFEWSSFFAMGVYALLAYAIVRLIKLIKPTSKEEVDQSLNTQ
jgi:hypothetical protein